MHIYRWNCARHVFACPARNAHITGLCLHLIVLFGMQAREQNVDSHSCPSEASSACLCTLFGFSWFPALSRNADDCIVSAWPFMLFM